MCKIDNIVEKINSDKGDISERECLEIFLLNKGKGFIVTKATNGSIKYECYYTDLIDEEYYSEDEITGLEEEEVNKEFILDCMHELNTVLNNIIGSCWCSEDREYNRLKSIRNGIIKEIYENDGKMSSEMTERYLEYLTGRRAIMPVQFSKMYDTGIKIIELEE